MLGKLIKWLVTMLVIAVIGTLLGWIMPVVLAAVPLWGWVVVLMVACAVLFKIAVWAIRGSDYV